MNNEVLKSETEFKYRKIFQYFFQGLVVIAPIVVTVYVVFLLFNTVDNILPNIIHALFPGLVGVEPDGTVKKIPGLGFIVVIVLVTLIGWLSSSFFVSRLVDVFDKVLERTPGVKFIYSSVKDFLEAFTGNKRKFDKPVLANVDSTDVWRVGFITQQQVLHFDMEDHVIVYVPHSYAISGITYIVPKHKIKMLNNVGAAEAMKFIISGGIAELS
ncbi:MAG: DUF502 domain-containing protein [Chitinophagaceae bacterium]